MTLVCLSVVYVRCAADEVASYFQPLSEKEHGPELDLPRRRLEGDRWDVGLGKRFRYTNKSF